MSKIKESQYTRDILHYIENNNNCMIYYYI